MGLRRQQVFTWRRQARQAPASTESEAPQFVPAIVETAVAITAWRVDGGASGPARAGSRPLEAFEVEIDGMTVRIGRGAEAKTVAAVLRALKAGA